MTFEQQQELEDLLFAFIDKNRIREEVVISLGENHVKITSKADFFDDEY